MIKILIMGLPGSGKTTLAKELINLFEKEKITYEWFNGDAVREKSGNRDFSLEGRLKQTQLMADLANSSEAEYVICDYICPLKQYRNILDPDWIIWVDTIKEGRYEDTNRLFEKPDNYDIRIIQQDAEKESKHVFARIINDARFPIFDWNKPTTQLLGRYQPWHAGHRALFEKALDKTGQVIIMVRACPQDKNNPFSFKDVKRNIERDLDPYYKGTFQVIQVPDIVNITYGRKVGYKIEQEFLGEEIEKISATAIRKNLVKN